MTALLIPATALAADLLALVATSPQGLLMAALLGVTAFLLRRWQ